jgi:pilus assembly protein Flp/PilA
MNYLMQKVAEFLNDEDGLTATEYAIAGGLVGAAVIGAFTDLGVAVGNVITGITNAITPTVPAP